MARSQPRVVGEYIDVVQPGTKLPEDPYCEREFVEVVRGIKIAVYNRENQSRDAFLGRALIVFFAFELPSALAV